MRTSVTSPRKLSLGRHLLRNIKGIEYRRMCSNVPSCAMSKPSASTVPTVRSSAVLFRFRPNAYLDLRRILRVACTLARLLYQIVALGLQYVVQLRRPVDWRRPRVFHLLLFVFTLTALVLNPTERDRTAKKRTDENLMKIGFPTLPSSSSTVRTDLLRERSTEYIVTHRNRPIALARIDRSVLNQCLISTQRLSIR